MAKITTTVQPSTKKSIFSPAVTSSQATENVRDSLQSLTITERNSGQSDALHSVVSISTSIVKDHLVSLYLLREVYEQKLEEFY